MLLNNILKETIIKLNKRKVDVMKLNTTTIEYLTTLNTIVKSDRLIFNVKDNKVIIPSRKYPLINNELEVFYAGNTEQLEDAIIKDIYNSLTFKKGRCYNNTKILFNALRNANINDIEIFSGWLIVNGELPVHHCFVVYKRKHLLDPSINNDEFINELNFRIENMKDKNIEKQREVFVKLSKEKSTFLESELTTFGKAASYVTYVATRSTTEEAIELFKKLREAYPNHEAYATDGMSMGKLSKLQEML